MDIPDLNFDLRAALTLPKIEQCMKFDELFDEVLIPQNLAHRIISARGEFRVRYQEDRMVKEKFPRLILKRFKQIEEAKPWYYNSPLEPEFPICGCIRATKPSLPNNRFIIHPMVSKNKDWKIYSKTPMRLHKRFLFCSSLGNVQSFKKAKIGGCLE